MPKDQLQLSQQGRQQAAMFARPPQGRLRADGFVNYYQANAGTVNFPTVPAPAAAPLADPAPQGGTGYRQPRVVAGQFADYFRRVVAGEPVPQVGYNKPRTAPLPEAAPARFAEADYPPSLLNAFPSHGQMLDAFAPLAYQRVYKHPPGPAAPRFYRRWLAAAFGTTSLTDPPDRYRHHSITADRSPAAIAEVTAYRREVYEAMVDIFAAHPEYGEVRS